MTTLRSSFRTSFHSAFLAVNGIALTCFLLASFASLLACASAGPAVPATPARAYPPAAVERIMAMRERGDSLAQVAREVGGTRADVRSAERQELSRRRQLRARKPGTPTAPDQVVATTGPISKKERDHETR
jgi:hypothetical protein